MRQYPGSETANRFGGTKIVYKKHLRPFIILQFNLLNRKREEKQSKRPKSEASISFNFHGFCVLAHERSSHKKIV